MIDKKKNCDIKYFKKYFYIEETFMLKRIISIASILILSACGGGSNDEKEPVEETNTKPEISSSYTTIYMKENSTLNIPLTVKNKENENLYFEIQAPDYINANVNASNNLILNSQEVNTDSKDIITVIVTDSGNLSDDIKFNINVENIENENEQISLEVYQNNIQVWDGLTSSIRGRVNYGAEVQYRINSKDPNITTRIEVLKHGNAIPVNNPYVTLTENSDSLGFIVNFDTNGNISSEQEWQEKVIEDYNFQEIKVRITASNSYSTTEKTVNITANPTYTMNKELMLAFLSYLENYLGIVELNLSEDKEILKYLVEILENKEIIKIIEKEELIKEIEAVNIKDTTNADIMNFYKSGGISSEFGIFLGIEGIKRVLENTDNSEEIDNVFYGQLNAIGVENILKAINQTQIERFSKSGDLTEQYIEELKSKYSLNIPDLDFSTKYEYGSGYSSFIGNSNYGYVSNDIWNAYSKYSFLEGALAKHYKTIEFKTLEGTKEGGE